jgi:hypothetical protein
VETKEKKEREPAERKGKTNMSFYAKESEVKRAFLVDQPMIILMKLTNHFLVWLFLCCRSSRMYFRRRCQVGCHPLEALSIKLISYLGPLFQTDQPIRIIQRRPRSFKGKLRERECCANYNTRKCTNRLQYSVLQVRGRSHRELSCEN